uniref:Uncharacterized protein n=1 Tax=Ixodes ricinus TaxID=34613 RepID=A0A6B0UKL0_IXORI
MPTHVWLCVAFPCLGKRASWCLSRARGRFGPFGPPRVRQYTTSAHASHRRESWYGPARMIQSSCHFYYPLPSFTPVFSFFPLFSFSSFPFQLLWRQGLTLGGDEPLVLNHTWL